MIKDLPPQRWRSAEAWWQVLEHQNPSQRHKHPLWAPEICPRVPSDPGARRCHMPVSMGMAPWAPHIPREVTVQGYRAHHGVLGKSTLGWKAGPRAALILGWILEVCKLATEGPGGPRRWVGSLWGLGTGSWWGCRSGLATEETHLNMCMSVQCPLEGQGTQGQIQGWLGV